MDDLNFRADEVLKLWLPIRENAFRIVNSITRDPHLTEDVLQEALISATLNFHALRDVNKFDKWFFVIAVRIAYKMLKERKKTVSVEDIFYSKEFHEKGNQIMDRSLLLVEDNDEMVRMLKKLTQRERHLIYLRISQGMKIREISRLTGIKEGTLKSIFHRAYKKIKELYIKEHPNE